MTNSHRSLMHAMPPWAALPLLNTLPGQAVPLYLGGILGGQAVSAGSIINVWTGERRRWL